MPLNSVVSHVKSKIDGIPMPTGLTFDGTNQVPALQAHIAIPVGTLVSDGPHAFVWGAYFSEQRQTMGGPRATQVGTVGSPFRNTEYRLDIVLRYALPNMISKIDSCFPVVVDTVQEILRGITMPVNIIDPITGRPSTITDVGEKFDVTFGQVYQLADQRLWLYGAKIVMRVKEVFQQ